MTSDIQPESGLSRLLASENSASDLLAMLIDLDDQPVTHAFGAPAGKRYFAVREKSTTHGRIDLVINEASSGEPAVVVEMKGASSIHGDQLDRYLNWTRNLTASPQLVLCAFDEDEAREHREWSRVRLRDAFFPWTRSSHPHAAWLATDVVRILDEWDQEAEGPLGARRGYYVADIVTKRLARDLPKLMRAVSPVTDAKPYRDNGGSPMVFAWASHPRNHQDSSVAVGVDLRSPTRRSDSLIWKLRPNIEVDVVEGERDLNASRHLAFKLAKDIHLAMSCSAIVEQLRAHKLDELAGALSGGRSNGFKSSISTFDLDTHATRIKTEKRYPGAGPFGNDRGLRLATILDLDVTNLSRFDMATLVSTIIEHLHSSAAAALTTNA